MLDLLVTCGGAITVGSETADEFTPSVRDLSLRVSRSLAEGRLSGANGRHCHAAEIAEVACTDLTRSPGLDRCRSEVGKGRRRWRWRLPRASYFLLPSGPNCL